MPIAVVFVVDSDVATPLAFKVSPAAGVPICVPAVPSHPPDVTSDGWQRKNFTVPVGTGCPAPPVTVAVSLTDVPGTTLPPVGLDVVAVFDGCLAVVKHSLVLLVWLAAG